MATHYSFFVQAKATDNIDKFMRKGEKHLRVPIKLAHIQHWNQFWEPIILTIWDAKSNITYWEIVQDFLEQNSLAKSQSKSIRIAIPTDNILDEEGLRSISERTRLRFNPFERVSKGIQVLVDLLERHFNVKVTYNLGDEIMSLKNSSGGMVSTFFGELGQALIARRFEMFTTLFDNSMPGEKLLLFLLGLAISIGLLREDIIYEVYPDLDQVVIRSKDVSNKRL